MGKIDDMIREICPEGVEFIPIGKLCEIRGRIGFRGYTRADLVSAGEGAISLSPSNIINGELNYTNCSYISWFKYDESPEIKVSEGDILFCKTASVGKTCLVKKLPEKATINPQFILLKNIQCNNSYLSYCLKESKFQNEVTKITGKGTIPTFSQKDFASLEIPVPPLPVQEEIVRVLDTFTELTSELTSELTARKKQYEYYREKLLTADGEGDTKIDAMIREMCPEGVEYKPLKEVTLMKRGTSSTKEMMEDGSIPVISGGRQPAFYCNQYNREGEVITVAGSGAGAGYVQYWKEPIFVCDAFSVQATEILSTKFVYYCMADIQEKIYSTKKGSGVPHVHISSIEKFEIPVPPLSVQQEIVRILDKFSTLTSDLSSGLPAEIDAVNKQYEYYRNKLLTFKRKGA